jgi:hypothetical protein
MSDSILVIGGGLESQRIAHADHFGAFAPSPTMGYLRLARYWAICLETAMK